MEELTIESVHIPQAELRGDSGLALPSQASDGSSLFSTTPTRATPRSVAKKRQGLTLPRGLLVLQNMGDDQYYPRCGITKMLKVTSGQIKDYSS